MTTGGNRLVSPGTGVPRSITASAETAHRFHQPRIWPRGWWFDVLMLAIFAAITIALFDNKLLNLDAAALHWSDNHRNAITWWTGYALSCLGQGGPLTYGTLVISLVLGWRRRSIRPVLIPVAAFLLTYLIVGPIKVLTNRAVPHHGPIEMFGLTEGPFAMAYPSGHTANAIVWYGALLILIGGYLPRWLYWLARIGAPLTVAVTMVYIDYHWLTDVLAALPLGLVLSRIIYRIPWETMTLPPWGRRAADPRLERSVDDKEIQPALWTRLPQFAARVEHGTGQLSKLWSVRPPRTADRPEPAVHTRRPAPIGPAGRNPRVPRGRSSAGGRPVRLREDFD